MSCHYGNPSCRDTSDDTHECRVPVSDEPLRCSNCQRLAGLLIGGCCRNCLRDLDAPPMPAWRLR